MKLTAYDEMLTMFGDPIGIGTKLSVILVIFAEFFCGIFVTLGFLTRLTIIPILITMIVVFFVAHAKDAFDMKALPLVYLLLCVVIFILGSGRYSVDSLLFRNSQSKN
jgi:putative oxidoreductase